MSNAMLNYTTQCGIELQHTVCNRPQQNGVTECANRVLAERITAMLDESGVKDGDCTLWGVTDTDCQSRLLCCMTDT